MIHELVFSSPREGEQRGSSIQRLRRLLRQDQWLWAFAFWHSAFGNDRSMSKVFSDPTQPDALEIESCSACLANLENCVIK